MRLQVTGLHHDFPTPRGPLHAVRGVDLEVQSGETLALVGESGSGKSTTARAVARLIEPTAGRVLLDGEDLLTAGSRRTFQLRRRIQFVFQDPYSSLDPRRTIGKAVREPLDVHRIGTRQQRDQKVVDLLGLVGLDPEYRHSFPSALSGGQRQRVAIARALALDPQFVICDEAVSALDVSIQAQILNLIRDLQEGLGVGFIFITHDLAVVSEIADSIAVMYLGRVVESGTREEVLADPQHPYTQALLSAAPGLRGLTERIVLQGESPSALRPPSGCAFRLRCPRAQERCSLDDPALAPVTTGDPHLAACHFPGRLTIEERRT
jgi:oligopeptide/dipeptide ABC transporter ATP-binding protein